MKLLVIVIICAFAIQDSLGQVDSSELTAAFIAGGNTIPVSTIEGQSAENLREIILNDTALYINRIVNDLARQIDVQSHVEVTALELALETFNYQVEQLPVDAAADSLDIALRSLNLKIVQAFNLIPTTLGGNAVTKPKKVSDKKDKPSSGESKPPKVNTLFELMNNLGQILEKDLSTLYKFEKKFLSAGFEGVDGDYVGLQEELRTSAINEHIVPVLQLIIRDVQAKADIAQAHVNAVTWDKFVALNAQLETVMATAGITEATEISVTTETTEANEVNEVTEEAATTESEVNEVTEEAATTESEVNEVTEEAATTGSEVNEVTEEVATTESEVNGINETTEVTDVTEGDE